MKNDSGSKTKPIEAEPQKQPASPEENLRKEIDNEPRAEWKIITESCDPPEDEDTIKL